MELEKWLEFLRCKNSIILYTSTVLCDINTKTLAESADDYYVRVEDLCVSLLPVNQWCSSTTLLPDVSTEELYSNGVSQTYNIIKDCNIFSLTAPVIIYTINTIYIHKNIKYCGFVGTKSQLNVLLVEEYNNIQYALNLMGYAVTYRNRNIWSSTPNSEPYIWSWYGTRWNSFNKTVNWLNTIPFFNIY